MRLALLSNVTIEVLAGMLKKEHDLWMPSGFGAWMETALSVPEDLKAFNPEAIFILIDNHYTPSTLDSCRVQVLSPSRREVQVLSPSRRVGLFLSSTSTLDFDSPHPSTLDFDSPAITTAVSSLESALPQTTVIVPDLADLALELEEKESSTLRLPTSTSTPPSALRLPTSTSTPPSALRLRLPTSTPPTLFYDDRMWKLGSMPWSLKGLRAIKDEINRLIRAMKGERKKVLALDFDNTLWQGVIGEDGVKGIEPFADFQREIKALRERGVLLVGLTKNNAADVEPVWDDPRMVLKRNDFVDLRIDWNDKPANLSAVAQALNLGSDSFVFVDDNPAERAQMAAQRPEVVVPEWPVSIRRLARLYFPKLRVTDEDRQKTDQYHAESKRKELAASLSVEDYLKSLEIRTEIHPIVESEFPRVAQLSQKTNQFNVCTNRYTVDDIARFAADPNHLLVTLHASDKFGDQGLVAFVHAVESKSRVEVEGCEKSKLGVEVEERIDQFRSSTWTQNLDSSKVEERGESKLRVEVEGCEKSKLGVEVEERIDQFRSSTWTQNLDFSSTWTQNLDSSKVEGRGESKSRVEVEERNDSTLRLGLQTSTNLRLGLQTSTQTYEITDWVMSCRVMNRRIEYTVQHWVEDELKSRGCTKLLATWRKTAKNAPVKELFERFGFTLTTETNEVKLYERNLV